VLSPREINAGFFLERIAAGLEAEFAKSGAQRTQWIKDTAFDLGEAARTFEHHLSAAHAPESWKVARMIAHFGADFASHIYGDIGIHCIPKSDKTAITNGKALAAMRTIEPLVMDYWAECHEDVAKERAAFDHPSHRATDKKTAK